MKSELINQLFSNHKLLKEGGWVVTGQIITAVIQLIGLRIITEFLPVDSFGQATLWLGIIVLIKSLFMQPVFNYQIRYYTDFFYRNEEASFRSFTLKIISGLSLLSSIIFILISLLLIYLEIINDSVILIFLVTAYFLVEVFKSYQLNQLSAKREQKVYSLWIITEAIATYSLVYLLIFLYPTTETYIIALGSGILISILIFANVNRKIKTLESNNNIDFKKEIRTVLKYSSPFILIAILSWIMNLSSRYFLGIYSSTYEAGLFVAAFSIASRPFTMLSGVVTSFLRPILFQAQSMNNEEKVKIIERSWLYLIAACGLVFLIILVAGNEIITSLLLAKEYRSSTFQLFLFIGIGYFGLATFQVFENFLLAKKKSKEIMYANIVGTITFIVSNILLVEYYTLIGASISVSISFLIQLLVIILLFKKTNSKTKVNTQTL